MTIIRKSLGYLTASALLLTIVALLALGTTAKAGDTANRFIFGFSGDARWFAFEEFGVQDGSGFPYSNIYIIDTKRDRWAPGTPVRVRIDDERSSVSTASRKARSKVRRKLDKYGIRVPGRLLASRPLSEVNASKDQVSFLPSYPYGSTITVRTETFEGKKSSKCFEDDRPLGLVIKGSVDDGAEQVLYRDTSVSPSRGCPLGYTIADIYRSTNTDDKAVTVVLVYVLTQGFEGKDARLLAIPLSLPTVQ